MAKPEPVLLKREAYPVFYRIEPRFADVDVLGHINNIAMAKIFEDARVRFHVDAGLQPHLAPGRPVIASLRIEYVAEAHYPVTIEVGLGVKTIGRSAWTVLAAAFQNERCVAVCEAVSALSSRTDSGLLVPEARMKLEERMVARS